MKFTFSSSCNERHIHVGEKFVEMKSCSHGILGLNATCSSVSYGLVLAFAGRGVRADIYIVDLPPYVKDVFVAWVSRNGVSKMKGSVAFWSCEDFAQIKWNIGDIWNELQWIMKIFRQCSQSFFLWLQTNMYQLYAADWFPALRNGALTTLARNPINNVD